jgi:uncharacterized protein YgiM (DUF1202 family)
MLCIAVVCAPLSVSADTDLALGSSAVVAWANGDSVNVRAEPSASAEIRGEVPEGSSVDVLDGPYWSEEGTGWYYVRSGGVEGFMTAEFLTDDLAVGASTGSAVALDYVNVRSGPSTADPILSTIEADEWVTLYGDAANGFVAIYSGDYVGWVHASYLSQDGSTSMDGSIATPGTPSAPDSEAATEQVDPGTRYTNDSVNLRSEASLESAVVTVLPADVELWITGNITNGLAETESDYGYGWVAVQYLTSEAPAAPAPAPAEEAPAAPAPSGSLISWPVSGGEWSFLQGYDSGLWQYGDSIDLVRTDGSTAGQPIYSPVNGTIRWFDPATGGVSIDMGNGYAFAMFHAYYDGSLQEGDTVAQGQYLGTIAPAYEAAAGSTPHLHIAVWATSDGGNWSRESVPFTGALALAGSEFYNSGVAFEHTGTVIYP